MRDDIFTPSRYKRIAGAIKDFLNTEEDFLSPNTAGSVRAAGDAIERILGENLRGFIGDECVEYSADFARRAMADIAFTTKDGARYVIDVKTHREDTQFNMPNLISAHRLARFYEDDNNRFVLLLAKYRLDGLRATFTEVTFAPIEFLSWNCLTVGALGWGQIQIADSNHINVKPGYPRKQWMLELCDAMLAFYPKEAAKIKTRIGYFQKTKTRWQTKGADGAPKRG